MTYINFSLSGAKILTSSSPWKSETFYILNALALPYGDMWANWD